MATTNPGKIAELRGLLNAEGWEVIGLGDLASPPPPVEETGTTFLENALLKADYYSRATGELTLTDDSGLEVVALEGRPGVYSARYGGEGLTDQERNAYLLGELTGVPEDDRDARFVCVLALVGEKDGKPIQETFSGFCEGKIALTSCGESGFGYDPIFVDPSSGRSFAELSPKEKLARSHRGQALGLLRAHLRSRLAGLRPRE
ncbi:MAG: RdgB/HAM1 family non-canonical purine NTP pyrophosphatase [Blastocatellia bacterium]|jgi:XTP/dITP diphosphohydrolase